MSAVDHRRSDRRFDRRLVVEFTHGGTAYPVETRNISLGGVFVATEMTLPYGTKVSLKMKLPDMVEPIVVDSHVRWIENEGGKQVGLGLRFEALRAKDIWALSKYLEATAHEGET